jgi:NAD(P)-dependent dehydrogenase (short-subunit alcohol dehydrogenase family)
MSRGGRVSALCPGFVRTRIGESGRNRPARYVPHPEMPAEISAAMDKAAAR